MTALPARTARADREAGPFAGFGNAVRKDTREWLATPRALATFLGAATFGVVATLGPWIGHQQGRRDPGLPLDATTAFAAGAWLTLLPLVAAFATLSIVAAERDRGTLAWSLSMPLSRDAFLASKLVTAIGMYLLLGIGLPMVIAAAAATVAYGAAPDAAAVALVFVGSAGLVVVYVLLQVIASVFAWSQAAGVVAALGTMLLAQALVALVPVTYDWLPLTIGEWVVRAGSAAPGPLVTPLAWVAAVAGLVGLARWRLAGLDL